MLGTAPASVKVFEQVRGLYAKSDSDGLKGSQANLLLADLKVRNVVLVNSGLLGKIDLSPSPLFTEVTNSLSERDADVACHSHYSRTILEAKSRL